MSKNPIASVPTGVIKLIKEDAETAWKTAIDVVDYPVFITPLYIDDPFGGEHDEKIPATGDTNTGRSTEFYGVVVDRDRIGVPNTIACVTGVYGTIPTSGIYRDFRDDLRSIGHKIESVYVTGNGGAQRCRVLITEAKGLPNQDIEMALTLRTSVDGTTKHSILLSAYDKKSGVELLGIGGRSMGVSARHTQSIGERHVAFSSILSSMITEWNSTIIPMLEIMGEKEFSSDFAVNLVESIMEDADFPKRHVEGAVASYLNTDNDSLFGVVKHISCYCDEEFSNKQERLMFFRDKLNKPIKKAFESLTKA